MKKTFIFGCTSLGRLLFAYLSREGRVPDAFVVDDAYWNADSFLGIPLFPSSRMGEKCPPDDFAAYVAVGYSGMNAVRQSIVRRLSSAGYQLPNYIHPSVQNGCESMGIGNLIFPGTILDVFTKIGDGNIFYPGGLLAHDSVIGNFNFFAPRAALAGDIIVGDRCFFGLNCAVKNEVHIGDRSLVGAGAYVRKDLEPGSVLAAPRSVLLEKSSEDAIRSVLKKG